MGGNKYQSFSYFCCLINNYHQRVEKSHGVYGKRMSGTTWLEPTFDIILAWFKEYNHVTSLSSATNLKADRFLVLDRRSYTRDGEQRARMILQDGVQTQSVTVKVPIWHHKSGLLRWWTDRGNQEGSGAGRGQPGGHHLHCSKIRQLVLANWGPAPCMSLFPDAPSRKHDYDGGLQETTAR